MTDLDGYPGDMDGLERLTDRDIERILAGDETRPADEAWIAIVDAVRVAAQAQVDPYVAARHVATAVTAATEVADLAARPREPVPNRTSWRRRTVFAGLLSTLAGKIAVAGAGVALAAAGAGAAGVLPGPAQDFVDDAVFGREVEPAGSQVKVRVRVEAQDPAAAGKRVRTEGAVGDGAPGAPEETPTQSP